MSNKITFFKGNRIDGKTTMDVNELEPLFLKWMKSKENAWLGYYYSQLATFFVEDNKEHGLNSAIEPNEAQKLQDALSDTKWEYLESIGIK